MALGAVIAIPSALGLFEMRLARRLRRLRRRPEPPAPDPLVRRPPRGPSDG
jgi:hypothetical protein